MTWDTQRESIRDLQRVPEKGKAELVNGDLVLMSPTGAVPGRAAGRIYRSLDDYERATDSGYAFPDNVGFVVDLPHRRSFSPDAAFWVGELPGSGQFLQGAPVFAVEVRSENDYGPEAELDLARKRADYFAAGTLVIWDVDVLRGCEVRVYRASAPDRHLPPWRARGCRARPAGVVDAGGRSAGAGEALEERVLLSPGIVPSPDPAPPYSSCLPGVIERPLPCSPAQARVPPRSRRHVPEARRGLPEARRGLPERARSTKARANDSPVLGCALHVRAECTNVPAGHPPARANRVETGANGARAGAGCRVKLASDAIHHRPDP